MFGLKGSLFLSGICAFFGHRDTFINDELEQKVESIVVDLINNGMDEFWVCNEGNFDWLSRMVMSRVKQEYCHFIAVCYICAYNPDKFSAIKQDNLLQKYELIYPDEVAKVPKKFAIEKRNQYIVDNADVIVCFVQRKKGGAYRAVHRAEKQRKKIINLALI